MTAAWIQTFRDGTFQRLGEYESGAIDADWCYIREWDDELFAEAGDIVDCVAWEKGKPSKWWLWRNNVTVMGLGELKAAWWDDRPARLLATPADFLRCHGAGFVILDWTADIAAILGAAQSVTCQTDDLANHLERVLTEQAKPKIRIIRSGLSKSRRSDLDSRRAAA